MNILVTGGNGQLGNELRKLASGLTQYKWFFTDVDTLDITSSEQVHDYFKTHQIGICINCAAYTAVDKAEDEPDLANKINAEAVNILADCCLTQKALLIHISTDYVFDGNHFMPYDENSKVQPVSAYGKSKALGESILQQHFCNSVIVRTSWLYSAFGNNFVKTMRKLGSERAELKVVTDQIGTPTWAFDLAKACIVVAEKYAHVPVKEIFHFSNEGVISWYDFALAIMKLEHLNCKVIPIESKDYPVKTKRPFYSVLNKSRFKSTLQFEIPYWRDSLINCLEELNGQNTTH